MRAARRTGKVARFLLPVRVATSPLFFSLAGIAQTVEFAASRVHQYEFNIDDRLDAIRSFIDEAMVRDGAHIIR